MAAGPYKLVFSREAADTLASLATQNHLQKKLKKVRKALGQLQLDPRYPALNSHKYSSVKGVNGEEVWDSYVENNTPSAWRIFWHYGPSAEYITVVSISPHP